MAKVPSNGIRNMAQAQELLKAPTSTGEASDARVAVAVAVVHPKAVGCSGALAWGGNT